MTPLPLLSHIPGPVAPPIVGHTLSVVRDPYGSQLRFIDRFGPVYKTKVLGVWHINLCGADAMEMVLMDRAQSFSSAKGWDAIERLFAGGLMLQDFAEHRRNRRIMQSAFRASALESYRKAMVPALEEMIAALPRGRRFCFYDAIKDLTLRIGCAVFLGLRPDDPQAARLNRALREQISAALSVIRAPLPMTPMQRGLRARAQLRAQLRGLIAPRRRAGGDDFFSRMCRARDEDGNGWTEEELLDQFNFLMMAAHDTTASALTAIVWLLGAHPQWQVKLADEARRLGPDLSAAGALEDMYQTDLVIKEALRLVPPVPFIPRRAVADVTWQGHLIPAGASVTVNPGVTMMSPALFHRPERFDPLRFAPNRAEDKAHKFAWAPFGGGAHKCIGMHFALMEIKLLLAVLLRGDRITLSGRQPVNWQRLPIPRPRCGLPIVLSRA